MIWRYSSLSLLYIYTHIHIHVHIVVEMITIHEVGIQFSSTHAMEWCCGFWTWLLYSIHFCRGCDGLRQLKTIFRDVQNGISIQNCGCTLSLWIPVCWWLKVVMCWECNSCHPRMWKTDDIIDGKSWFEVIIHSSVKSLESWSWIFNPL